MRSGRDDVSGRNGARRARATTKRRRKGGDDERPRGYHPQRMHQLWRDIDDARGKLGYDPSADTTSSGYALVALIGRSAALVEYLPAPSTVWTSAWRLVTAPFGMVASVAEKAVAVPVAVLGGAAAWLGRLPLVGGVRGRESR
jgi:hypothetical protein